MEVDRAARLTVVVIFRSTANNLVALNAGPLVQGQVPVEIVTAEDGVQSNTRAFKIPRDEVVLCFLPGSTKETDSACAPSELNRIVRELDIVGVTSIRYILDRLTGQRLCMTRPRGKAIITISTNIRITHARIPASLRIVQTIGEIVANTGVIDQHIFGVLHVFLVDIVTHPETTLEMFDPEVFEL